LKKSIGLEYFATNRAKFEGWIQVELCESLSYISSNITPEKSYRDENEKLKRTDIVIDNYAIELKTINTSYKTKDVEIKTKPITTNIDGIIKDINKLKDAPYSKKAVVFIVFPLEITPSKEWSKHIDRISDSLNNKFLRCIDFKFNNQINAKIYLVEV
jgi:hypothetical protein